MGGRVDGVFSAETEEGYVDGLGLRMAVDAEECPVGFLYPTIMRNYTCKLIYIDRPIQSVSAADVAAGLRKSNLELFSLSIKLILKSLVTILII